MDLISIKLEARFLVRKNRLAINFEKTLLKKRGSNEKMDLVMKKGGDLE